ncbi:MAG TPA: hypothetical protein DEX20_08740 [Halieaceae bacterium]|nr:hypothetical protein [Halieaceae bacterium]
MSNVINGVTTVAPVEVIKVGGESLDAANSMESSAKKAPKHESAFELTLDNVMGATKAVEVVVNKVAETSLSFSVENELNRMVVSVRSVGSDKLIRQFPPEEFLSVAKFIAAQNPDELSEDFLKGILFDQYS